MPSAKGQLDPVPVVRGEVCLLTDTPAVTVGETVALGQTVGTICGRPVFASISGGVTSVSDGIVMITDDGMDRKVEAVPFGIRTGKTLAESSSDELLAEIRSAGIVEADGQVLAEHIEKALERSQAGKLRHAAVSLLETDPASLSLSSLGVEFADAIAGGLSVLLKLLSVREGSILCDKERPETVDAIRAACRESKLIAVELPENIYPQGHSKLITRWLCNKELSAESSPEAAGLFLIDAESCIALYQLFVTGIPRLAVRTTLYENDQGRVYDLPLGLPIETILKAGLFQTVAPPANSSGKRELVKPSDPSPLCRGIMDFRPPADYVDRSLTVLTPASAPAESVTDCIRCGRCSAVCPMFLQPYRFLPEKSWIALLSGAPRDAICCIGCGCCSYVCPARLPLRRHVLRARETELLRRRERKSLS